MSANEEKSNPAIKPRENGPLLVTGLERLSNSQGVNVEGAQLHHRRTVALCRCGESKKKPFCDGSHGSRFTSANRADWSKNRRDDYESGELAVHDNRFLCAHVGACTDSLAAVFRSRREPWIDPSGAGVEEIMRAIERCPSGALAYTFRGEGQDEPGAEPGAEPGITVSKNGPYLVSGGIELEAEQWGEGAVRTRYALCRCGASRNKPFCDGSHWEAGFQDEKN